MQKRKKTAIVSLLLTLCWLLTACTSVLPQESISIAETTQYANSASTEAPQKPGTAAPQGENTSFDLSSIPAFDGSTAYVAINGNQPEFESVTTESYEQYAELDSLGRCGVCIACIGQDLMPQDGAERGGISSVTPTGWVQNQYDFVENKWVYNRCHLIGYQLTAENANPCNLITGTRYLNISGMLPFENMVADYIHETGNHVMYRVTPIFEGENLLASGVQMEGWSVEDDGEGICFNVYCYNVQPGVAFNYATGDNWEDSSFQPIMMR